MFSSCNSFPDVICFTETWFLESNTEEILGYKSYHTIRTERRSGGVSVYVRHQYNSKLLPNYSFCNNEIEICTVEILLNNSNILVIGIYRPHSGNISNFIENLNSILDEPYARNKLCVIVGDFNMNILSDNPQVNSFMYNMQSYHFFPLSYPAY